MQIINELKQHEEEVESPIPYEDGSPAPDPPFVPEDEEDDGIYEK